MARFLPATGVSLFWLLIGIGIAAGVVCVFVLVIASILCSVVIYFVATKKSDQESARQPLVDGDSPVQVNATPRGINSSGAYQAQQGTRREKKY